MGQELTLPLQAKGTPDLGIIGDFRDLNMEGAMNLARDMRQTGEAEKEKERDDRRKESTERQKEGGACDVHLLRRLRARVQTADQYS